MKKILIFPFDNAICKSDCLNWNVDEIVLKSEIHKYSIENESDNLIIFVPTIVNPGTAIEYDGASIALQLYMEAIRENKLDIRIVLLGVESEKSFLLNYNYPNILKCPGFDYIRFNQEQIKSYSCGLVRINVQEAKKAIERLGLELPKSYVSSHSFINEWSAFTWSEYMGFDSNKIKESFKENIYFDYRITLLPKGNNDIVSLERKKEIKNLKGKILLIDDCEYWHSFFKEFFDGSGVEVCSIGLEFRYLSMPDIVRICEEKFNEFKPNMVLLDFRLQEDQDYGIERPKISGVQVLRKLKGTIDNPGVGFGCKFIMFTATSKMDHIFALQRFGADGFIFKESPENRPGKPKTKEAISSIIHTIENMYLCSTISSSVCGDLDVDISFAKTIGNYGQHRDEFPIKVLQIVKTIRALLKGDFYNESILKLLYLEIFGILETLRINPRKKTINEEIQRVAPPLILKDWNNIDNLRNGLAHNKSIIEIDNKSVEIDNSLVAEWIVKLSSFTAKLLKHIASQKSS